MLNFNCQICDSRHAVSQLKPWNRSLEIWVSWGETRPPQAPPPPPALFFSIMGSSGVIAQAAIALKQLRSWVRKSGSWHQAAGRSEPIPTSLSNEELWENFPARGSLGRLSSEPAAMLLRCCCDCGCRPPTRCCLCLNACAFVLVACFPQTLIRFHAALRWTRLRRFRRCVKAAMTF